MRKRIKVSSIRVTNSPLDLSSLRCNESKSLPAIVRLNGVKEVKIPCNNVTVMAVNDIASEYVFLRKVFKPFRDLAVKTSHIQVEKTKNFKNL